MDDNMKYKRWGWGAVIVLIAVILVAGLVIAVNIKSPEKTDEIAVDNNTSVVSGDVEGKNADKNESGSQDGVDGKSGSTSENGANTTTDTKDDAVTSDTSGKKNDAGSATTTDNGATGALPKTGPTENILAIFAFAIIVSLIAYNVSLAKDFTLSVK